MKICARCKEPKTLADFYVNRGWADGRHPYCKQCLLAYQRERRRERLDHENPSRRRWSAAFVQHDYFESINDSVRAYVAGLLAADGNILEKQKRISLELSIRDQELVHFVRDELAPGFPVRYRARPNGIETAMLAVTSAALCDDLSRLGITPRKSLTLRWPRNLDRDFARAFLLGYFDGDGFVTSSRNGRYTYPRWGLCGTEMILAAAMRLITDEAGVSPRRVRAAGGGKSMHVLYITGADALVVDRWLHGENGLGLARKRLSPAPPDPQADIAASSSSLK